MLNDTTLFWLLGALLLVAFIANRGFQTTRTPDSIMLLIAGLLLGPVFGLIDPHGLDDFSTHLGTFALILILFESGLELNLRQGWRDILRGLVLSAIGYLVTVLLIAAACYWLLEWNQTFSLLAGAVLGCTSSTMVMPIIQQLRAPEHIRGTVLVESAMSDVLAVITVGSIIGLDQGDLELRGVITSIGLKILGSLMTAVSFSLVWRLWKTKRTTEQYENIFLLSLILLVYSLSRMFQGSGLLAVLAFAIAINLATAQKDTGESAIPTFHSDLAFFTRSFFFVLLGIMVKIIPLEDVIPVIAILLAIFAGRFAAVKILYHSFREWLNRDRRLLFWLVPRGLVTAVLAITVNNAYGPTMDALPAIAFTTILATNIILIFGTRRHQNVPGATETGSNANAW